MTSRRSGRRNRSAEQRRSARLALAQAIILVAGLLYMLSGILLLAQPEWFFDNIGNFPPFNRHYMGDLGSFLLPLGGGLLIASQNPSRHRLLISIGVFGSFFHAFNHWYDVLNGELAATAWFVDTLPLLVFGLLFLWAFWQVRGR